MVALNPVRSVILVLGLALSRVGLVDERRVRRTVDLSWPRIVTGLARMSKNAADVAMVGIGVGPAAIAGVGFASPYWGAAFTVGGGLAAGTIALVSQRFGAGAHDDLGQAVRASVVAVLALSVPLAAAFYLFPVRLVGILTGDPATLGYGAAYLRTLAIGVPFAGLNLVGSRVFIGADDAHTPMVFRGGGAAVNVGLNALFIFGLGMGVTGAALGTVLANVAVTAAFVVAMAAGRFPGLGSMPVSVSPTGRYVHRDTITDVVTIGAPVVGRNMVWTVSRFPMLAIVGTFGPTVVAAYVISRRVWGLMNTPGWGYGMAASSLVGQSLGENDEPAAEAYGREITLLSVATYVIAAAVVIAFARPIVALFVDGGTSDSAATVAAAVPLVYAAGLAVVAQGVSSAIAGALDATGDTRWPFYSRVAGMFGLAIPVAFLGATTPLGIWGIYLAYFAQTVLPAAVNYWRFSTGEWKAISRAYRPEPALDD